MATSSLYLCRVLVWIGLKMFSICKSHHQAVEDCDARCNERHTAMVHSQVSVCAPQDTVHSGKQVVMLGIHLDMV